MLDDVMKPDAETHRETADAVNHYSTIRFILIFILACIVTK
jgi:hypothetical protein